MSTEVTEEARNATEKRAIAPASWFDVAAQATVLGEVLNHVNWGH